MPVQKIFQQFRSSFTGDLIKTETVRAALKRDANPNKQQTGQTGCANLANFP